MSVNRGKRRSPDQIISALREADGLLSGGQTIAQLCQKLGASRPITAGGMKADAMKRLKQLEENRRLKKAVADLTAAGLRPPLWISRSSKRPMTTWERGKPDSAAQLREARAEAA